ncbi:MAG: carboxymuconolactone decarboxylase family protein [Erythrobacter sp.]
MSRIDIPATIADAPAGSQPFLEQMAASMGRAPNLTRMVGNSSAAVEGMMSLMGALGKGELNAATRERIAVAIANYNGCDYCNSAHTMVAKNVLKLDDAEVDANRQGRSTDAKADAALKFALAVAKERGRVSEADVSTVKQAGYSDAEVVEIIAHVALNILTNYMGEALDIEVDFPLIEADRAA